MEWLANTWLLLIIGLLPTFLSLILGGYWLKHERFPWEGSTKDLPESQDRKG